MLISAPIVTGTLTDATVDPWVPTLSIVGIVVGVFIGAISGAFFHVSLSEHGKRAVLGGIYCIAAALVCLGMYFSIASVTIYGGQDDRHFHSAAVGEAIADRYTIEAIHGLDDIKEGWRVDQPIKSFCHKVSTESPELTGIADGQQISFKVGIRDCRAKSPVADIIITKTPGPSISADDLLKKK